MRRTTRLADPTTHLQLLIEQQAQRLPKVIELRDRYTAEADELVAGLKRNRAALAVLVGEQPSLELPDGGTP